MCRAVSSTSVATVAMICECPVIFQLQISAKACERRRLTPRLPAGLAHVLGAPLDDLAAAVAQPVQRLPGWGGGVGGVGWWGRAGGWARGLVRQVEQAHNGFNFWAAEHARGSCRRRKGGDEGLGWDAQGAQAAEGRTLVWIQAQGPPCRASQSLGTRSSTSGSALGCMGGRGGCFGGLIKGGRCVGGVGWGWSVRGANAGLQGELCAGHPCSIRRAAHGSQPCGHSV